MKRILLNFVLGSSSLASQLSLINPLIGNGGDTPNGSGGMIPSVSIPFGMTRWVAQTQDHYVSQTPYNCSSSDIIYGFVGTHQPAIWMGETGCVSVSAGVGEDVKSRFGDRGLQKTSESFGVGLYQVGMRTVDGGSIKVNMSATSHVGYLRFAFSNTSASPYILIQASRPSLLYTVSASAVPGDMVMSYPIGGVFINPGNQEVCGYNSEMQDANIVPVSTVTSPFKGWFCARFNVPFQTFGTIEGPDQVLNLDTNATEGVELSAYLQFPANTTTVNVRVGTSFISMDQARLNINAEIPDGITLEETTSSTDTAWLEKIGRVNVQGSNEDDRTVFMTAVYHALQYPYEQHESGKYYSGYDNAVHTGESYTGYSIWVMLQLLFISGNIISYIFQDTFRAEWAFLILMAPERIPGMVRSMLQDYVEGGWLPMWKNIVETNIMVGTHADSLIAEAVLKGFRDGFDLDTAWAAVWKDATEPPVKDGSVQYYDREENVDYEVRAGLTTTYKENGWVADDIHSESASRTLDYAYDDYAAAQLGIALNKSSEAVSFLLERAMRAPFTIYNNATGFMEARNANGSWAGPDNGWTEGDKWAYSFDVVHDIPRLIEFRGGNESFVASLDAHFDGGHNDQSNEPSHHIPYLYAMAGAAAKTQERVRYIAKTDYNNTPTGLSGNEDCGQMSAWYIFSAMGFYPVDPVSGEYIVGSPLFDEITVDLPPHPFETIDETSPYYNSDTKGYRLTVSSPGAPTKPYVKSLQVNGKSVDWPVIRHEDIARGGNIVFEMSEEIQSWGGGMGSWTESQTVLIDHNEL